MSEEYVILVNGESEGPFSEHQLRAMVENGELTLKDKISAPGWDGWIAMRDVPGLNLPPTLPEGFSQWHESEPRKEGDLTARTFFGMLFVVTILFAPTGIAMLRRHPNTAGIVVVNWFLGWTIVGWAVALVWSLYEEKRG